MHWRADVVTHEQHRGETPRAVRRSFVLEADNDDAAFAAAKDAGKRAATFGSKLLGVDVLSVATINLPLEIKTPNV